MRKVTVHADSVSVGTDAHEYRARMIIGCDGANSIVARASGLRTGSVQSDYAIDMMEETPQEELSTAERDRMYIYYRIRSHYGYGYVFPKADSSERRRRDSSWITICRTYAANITRIIRRSWTI